MNDLFSHSAFFGVLISLFTYGVGHVLKRRIRFALFNPLLIAVVATIAFLAIWRIDYETYLSGASVLNWLLTPATVCLAIPLYEKLELLKRNRTAILAGIVSGVVTSVLCVFVMALLARLTHAQYVTLLPKSITTAIGIGVSEELGGYITLTVSVIITTGIIGNIFAQTACKIFRIRSRIAKGVAIGTAAHAIGTAKAMEMGKTEGAISSLSLVVAGLLTVGAASVASHFI
ncbi:MAG: LrgB family protein [Victivallaceae bacterium]|nr:LrgB family protein [Victivallaceae bacterium]